MAIERFCEAHTIVLRVESEADLAGQPWFDAEIPLYRKMVERYFLAHHGPEQASGASASKGHPEQTAASRDHGSTLSGIEGSKGQELD